MKDFENKLAVVTGGGTGMGRELVCQLVNEGAHVAMCDVSADNMAETESLVSLRDGQKLTSHICDVSSEADMLRFRDEIVEQHNADHINLLFNNAGIGGGGEFVNGDRDAWEKTFGVCWEGVYFCCRVFMELLVASEEGHIINTSSVNGFWASIGPNTSHTSYAAAKFAVKGFTEALITDLRLNAPHVKCSVVMPGHIGTSIAINSSIVLGRGAPLEMSAEDVALAREAMKAAGAPVDNLTDDHIRELAHQRATDFRDKAPTTAADAAAVILDGVREERWRILVGDDAHHLDKLIRDNPESAYDVDFIEKMYSAGHFKELVQGAEVAAQ